MLRGKKGIISLINNVFPVRMSFGSKGTGSKSVGIKLSTWTPQSNSEASLQMFTERKELVTKWWEKWNGKQRAECLTNLLGVCTNKQIRLVRGQ